MVGHQGVLIDSQGGMDYGNFFQTGFYDGAQMGCFCVRSPDGAGRQPPVAGYTAERRHPRALPEGDMINLALGVVMPGGAMVAGPDFSHDRGF